MPPCTATGTAMPCSGQWPPDVIKIWSILSLVSDSEMRQLEGFLRSRLSAARIAGRQLEVHYDLDDRREPPRT
jgi:hypothetical protein